MRSQKGFTLIETLVGLGIMGIIVIVLLIGLAISVKSNKVNNDLSKAENLAQVQVEYIQSQPYNALCDYSVMSIPADCSGFSYASPMVTTITTGLQKITVTVSNNQTSFTLVDYKVER